MNSLRKVIDFFLSKTIVLIMVILLTCVVWQVLARWFGVNSTYTDEAARFMFIWAGLFGAALAHSQGRHLAIDLLTSRLTGSIKKYSDIIICLLVITFAFLVMVYGGSKVMMNTQGQVSAVMRIPMWMIYIAIPLNGCLIMFYSLCDLIKVFSNKHLGHESAELC